MEDKVKTKVTVQFPVEIFRIPGAPNFGAINQEYKIIGVGATRRDALIHFKENLVSAIEDKMWGKNYERYNNK